jgi:RimJ/RimL family protein N-acetyltransferase
MPILSSHRLLFRQHEMADMDGFCAMEMDAEIRRYVGGRPRTREEAENRFKASLKPPTDRLSMWATVLKDTDTYIGRCGVYPHFDHDGQPIQGEGTLAFYIARMYWNNGYATEAGQAFIRFAFDDLKLNLLTATVQIGNDASVHILKKLGFELKWEEAGVRSFYHFELKNPVT